MADIPFINPKGGYAQLALGANEYSIPALPGSGLNRATNNRLLTAASMGQAGVGASNMVTGIKGRTLTIVTMAMASFFTYGFLNDLLTTRDAQGDLGMLDVKFCQGTGITPITDYGKLASMRLGLDRGSNFVSVEMNFLLLNQTNAASFAAYDHPEGVPILACQLPPSFTPNGGTKYAVYGSTGESVTFSTGAYGRKFSGGTETCDQLTHIAAPILAGAVTVDQQSGAEKRLSASESGLFEWVLTGGLTMKLGVSKMDESSPLNPGGEADSITNWQLYSGGNTGNILAQFIATA